MLNHLVVFGGWGISPNVLEPLFGNATYIDVNLLMHKLLAGTVLRKDWQDVFLEETLSLIGQPTILAGWSTGAMLAAALAPQLKPRAFIALSATGSFCRTPEYPSGVRPAVLKAMRIRLSTDPAGVLRDFTAQCGLPPDTPCSDASPDNLIAGLHVLEQLTIAAPDSIPCPALFFHGKNDSIIPVQSGELFCRQLGSTLHLLDGPHACFTTTTTVIKTICTSFFGGYLNESI